MFLEKFNLLDNRFIKEEFLLGQKLGKDHPMLEILVLPLLLLPPPVELRSLEILFLSFFVKFLVVYISLFIKNVPVYGVPIVCKSTQKGRPAASGKDAANRPEMLVRGIMGL